MLNPGPMGRAMPEQALAVYPLRAENASPSDSWHCVETTASMSHVQFSHIMDKICDLRLLHLDWDLGNSSKRA